MEAHFKGDTKFSKEIILKNEQIWSECVFVFVLSFKKATVFLVF